MCWFEHDTTRGNIFITDFDRKLFFFLYFFFSYIYFIYAKIKNPYHFFKKFTFIFVAKYFAFLDFFIPRCKKDVTMCKKDVTRLIYPSLIWNEGFFFFLLSKVISNLHSKILKSIFKWGEKIPPSRTY